MSTDSPIEPRSPEEVRYKYSSVEGALASTRELIRWSALVTACWGFGLVMETFTHEMHSGELKRYSLLPQFILPLSELTAWHSGIGAVCVFSLYYLMNYAMDALQPGSGKPHAKTSAWIVVICIGVFGPTFCAPIFCIGPAITLIRPGSKVVLSAKYRETVEATPWISDVNRRKQQTGTSVWIGVLAIILGLVAIALITTYA